MDQHPRGNILILFYHLSPLSARSLLGRVHADEKDQILRTDGH